MRWCRFNNDRYGIVEDGLVYDITAIVDEELSRDDTGAPGDRFIAHIPAIADRLRTAQRVAVAPEAEIQFLSPVEHPTKVIAAPVNYALHIAEAEKDAEINRGSAISRIDTAGLFLKATSSLVGPSEGIALRFPDRRTDHELEIAIVIGRRAAHVSPAAAPHYIGGYALALDVTLRGTEDRSFRKSIDTYSVLGPYLISPDEITDPTDLAFSLRVNGELRQSSSTRHMIKDIATLVAWASQWYTLHPGDVLMTGTPEGVGPLADGDRCELDMPGLAAMTVDVRTADVLPVGGATGASHA